MFNQPIPIFFRFKMIVNNLLVTTEHKLRKEGKQRAI